MIAPWAKIAWESNRDQRALETLKASARTLLGRFNKEVGLIRSWDTCVTKRYRFLNPENEFLTVIVIHRSALHGSPKKLLTLSARIT